MSYSTKRPAPPVAALPLVTEDYPRLFALGKWAARATESMLELITPYDHNQIDHKAYLDKLGYTFTFRKLDDRVYVSVSGEVLIGCTDQQIINGITRQIKELSRV